MLLTDAAVGGNVERRGGKLVADVRVYGLRLLHDLRRPAHRSARPAPPRQAKARRCLKMSPPPPNIISNARSPAPGHLHRGWDATLTATAATNCKRQRSAAHQDASTRCSNLGYVRPEKQTVGDQRRSGATVANTVAKPLDGARRMWTTLEYRPSLRPVTDGLGRLAHSYGSDRRPTEEPGFHQFEFLAGQQAFSQHVRQLGQLLDR
jgi:hypothetical protein